MENRARKVIVKVEAELDDGSKYAHEFVFLAPKSFTMSEHKGYDTLSDTLTGRQNYVANGKDSFELKIEMEKP